MNIAHEIETRVRMIAALRKNFAELPEHKRILHRANHVCFIEALTASVEALRKLETENRLAA